MGKPRKRHVQTEIVFKKWGGARKGAGRKRRGPRRQVPHLRREDFDARHPLHLTLRVLDEVGRLRRRDAFHAVRKSMLVVAAREDFRIGRVAPVSPGPPQIRTCGFPASGSSRGGFATCAGVRCAESGAGNARAAASSSSS